MPVIKFLGSLKFAVFLIAVLASMLTASTITESVYGTPFAQKLFYRAGWFDLFLAALWLNIFFAAVLRYPFRKKHHIGFVTTHIGILILLIGALLARLLGSEGQMPVLEGEKSNRILQDGLELRVLTPDGRGFAFPMKPQKDGRAGHLRSPDGRIRITVHQTMDKAGMETDVAEGPASDPANAAAKIRLNSERAGLERSFWIIERDPENPHSASMSLGPARIELETPRGARAAEEPTLIVKKAGGEEFQLALGEKTDGTFPAFGGEFKITNLRYFPNAKVIQNELVNSPADTPFNPAVAFDIAKGERVERHTKFALFPDFDSLHGGKSENIFNFKVELKTPAAPAASGMGGSLRLKVSENGQWSYAASSASNPGAARQGSIAPGQSAETGWMDMKFTLEEVRERARVRHEVKPNADEGVFAALLEFQTKQGASERRWIFDQGAVEFKTPDGAYQAALLPASVKVPFVLLLKDFRKKDYPGTMKPASFESDVVLYDPKKNLWFQKTIRMNEPLDYAGWRIFQSSYFGDERGEGSVFTVAKNPGIIFIYGGAIILFAGAFMLFYVTPFSRDSKNTPREKIHA